MSANWVLGILCALSFNIVLACRRRRVAGLYIVSRLRVMLVQLIGEASPEDEERLFTWMTITLTGSLYTLLFLLCLLQGHK